MPENYVDVIKRVALDIREQLNNCTSIDDEHEKMQFAIQQVATAYSDKKKDIIKRYLEVIPGTDNEDIIICCEIDSKFFYEFLKQVTVCHPISYTGPKICYPEEQQCYNQGQCLTCICNILGIRCRIFFFDQRKFFSINGAKGSEVYPEKMAADSAGKIVFDLAVRDIVLEILKELPTQTIYHICNKNGEISEIEQIIRRHFLMQYSDASYTVVHNCCDQRILSEQRIFSDASKEIERLCESGQKQQEAIIAALRQNLYLFNCGAPYIETIDAWMYNKPPFVFCHRTETGYALEIEPEEYDLLDLAELPKKINKQTIYRYTIEVKGEKRTLDLYRSRYTGMRPCSRKYAMVDDSEIVELTDDNATALFRQINAVFLDCGGMMLQTITHGLRREALYHAAKNGKIDVHGIKELAQQRSQEASEILLRQANKLQQVRDELLQVSANEPPSQMASHKSVISDHKQDMENGAPYMIRSTETKLDKCPDVPLSSPRSLFKSVELNSALPNRNHVALSCWKNSLIYKLIMWFIILITCRFYHKQHEESSVTEEVVARQQDNNSSQNKYTVLDHGVTEPIVTDRSMRSR